MMWCGQCKQTVNTIHHCVFRTIDEAIQMKLYKCQGVCGEAKPLSEFYAVKSGDSVRASPYCITCNPDSSLLNKYKSEIRRQGSKAFGDKIKQKENQLRLMLKAVKEVRI